MSIVNPQGAVAFKKILPHLLFCFFYVLFIVFGAEFSSAGKAPYLGVCSSSEKLCFCPAGFAKKLHLFCPSPLDLLDVFFN
jgi:hypothetical protein